MSRTTAGSRLSTRRKCLFSGIVLVCALMSLELISRWLEPRAASNLRYRQIQEVLIYLGKTPGHQIFEPDPERFWRMKPGLNGTEIGDRRWTGFLSNSLGFRNAEFQLQAADETFRIACFGDSTTFGFGVAQEQAWPQQLENLLNGQRGGEMSEPGLAAEATQGPLSATRFEVINAGVPGYSSYQGLRYVHSALPWLLPDMVVLTFGTNDSWYWDGHTDAELAQSLHAAGPALLEHSSLFRQLQRLTGTLRRTQSDADQAWARRSWWSDVAPDWQPRVSLDEFADHMQSMIQLCQNSNAACLVLIWPDRRQLHGQPSRRDPYVEQLRAIAQQHPRSVRLVDVLEACRSRSLRADDLLLPDDPVHFAPAGNRLVAEQLVQALTRLQPLGQTGQP